VVLAAAAPASASSSEARWFHSPSGNIQCELRVRSALGTSAFCVSKRPVRCATLNRSGEIVRHQNCLLGDPRENAFTLRYGKSVRLGPFRCTSRRTGMRCVVTQSGHGFTISRKLLATF
jgi:hypothetical protein